MKVCIVLGNRMNDDATLSNKMIKRLELTLYYYNEYHPNKIIVSGGIANPVAGVSEASGMHKWLVEHGIPDEVIIEEGNSMTTVQNAKFSVPIAKSFNPDTIIVITSSDHHFSPYYSVAQVFNEQINDEKIKVFYLTDGLHGKY